MPPDLICQPLPVKCQTGWVTSYGPDSNNQESEISKDQIKDIFSDSTWPMVTSSLKGTFLMTVMYITTAYQCNKR